MNCHPRDRRRLASGIFGLSILVVTGCHSIGPSAVRRDRLHYSSAVAESWKEQLLLNIVKTRYGDAPAFLEVVSVVSGYTLETGVSLGGQFSPQSLRGDTFAAGGVSGTYTDRPTISYSPMSGEKFARSLLAPVPLDAIWSVIQGGVPPDFLLSLTLESVEGHHNLGLYAGRWTPMDPEFLRLMELVRLVRHSHVADSEVLQEGDRLEVWLQLHELKESQAALAPPMAELKGLLGIPAGTNRAKLRFATLAPEPDVVGMRSRSLMQILSTLGAGVRFPSDRLARGGIIAAEAPQTGRGFTVHSGIEKPEETFVAVPYDGLWFWIDPADLPSKTTLAAVTVLFNFLEAGGSKAAPVLTIPAN